MLSYVPHLEINGSSCVLQCRTVCNCLKVILFHSFSFYHWLKSPFSLVQIQNITFLWNSNGRYINPEK